MSATAQLVGANAIDASRATTVPGVVSVRLLGPANTTAGCSCGWAGRRRFLKAAAEQDAWAHSAQDGCDVATPLVLSW